MRNWDHRWIKENRWIKNPWGRHCWIDFIYAAVNSGLRLLDINESDIRTIGIDLSWNLGEGYFEPACDAILNFGNHELKKKITIFFYHLENKIPIPDDPLPARSFYQRKYSEDGFNGIEFNNWL